MLLVFALASMQSLAIIDSCTLNNPQNNQYDQGQIRYNVTVVSTNNSVAYVNITNVTITVGSTLYNNGTINGTKTNYSAISGTANVDTIKTDFTFSINSTQLQANRIYGVFATCYNSSDTSSVSSINSSNITYVIDTATPSVTLAIPLAGSTVVPNNNIVTFEYTPADTNFGNCTLHLNNQLVKASTSGTTSPNITSNKINRFTQIFGADNSSVRAAIHCIDLAGLDAGSNNFTFAVLLGATSPAVKALQQAQSGGGGGFVQQPASSGFSVVNAASNLGIPQNHLEKYGFIYIIAVVLLIVLAVRKFKK